MQKITILGATGSIGASTLAVIEQNRETYRVFALSANNNVEKMVELVLHWQPEYVAMADESSALELEHQLKSCAPLVNVLAGTDGVRELAALAEADVVMAAIVGAAGLLPTMEAVKAGKKILLANKEALVMSGQFFIDAAQHYQAKILPVDSEHNAIYQSLPVTLQDQIGYCELEKAGVHSILLTGSGGPFRYSDIETLNKVTPEMAIAHPNWSMGRKISVDSATMMNKGLEYIEAKWLFNARKEQLKVVIHPQSVIHSMVQYIDGSVIAQMGEPDMSTPIAHAMAYPSRIQSGVNPLDFTKLSELTFLEPDMDRYPCLKLAMEACYTGQHATTAINAANEIAVDAFLNEKIKFTDIVKINEKVMTKVCNQQASLVKDLNSVLEIDSLSRIYANEYLENGSQ